MFATCLAAKGYLNRPFAEDNRQRHRAYFDGVGHGYGDEHDRRSM